MRKSGEEIGRVTFGCIGWEPRCMRRQEARARGEEAAMIREARETRLSRTTTQRGDGGVGGYTGHLTDDSVEGTKR